MSASITIKLDGQEIVLSLDEAKTVKSELEKIFSKEESNWLKQLKEYTDRQKSQVVREVVYIDRPIYYPSSPMYPRFVEIYCGGNSLQTALGFQ